MLAQRAFGTDSDCFVYSMGYVKVNAGVYRKDMLIPSAEAGPTYNA